MKRLRKFLGNRKVRFFACGEYGEERGRPHYHIILFNVTVEDLRLYSDFYSHKLRGRVGFCKLWLDDKGEPIGRITVQNILPAHYKYVAKYTSKKYHGEKSDIYEEVFGRIPEFIQMSRRPGIGHDEALAQSRKIRRNFGILLKPGKVKSLPRYFVNLIYPDKEDIAYKEYVQRRLDYVLQKQHEWWLKHPNLSREEMYDLQMRENAQAIETLKRSMLKGKFYYDRTDIVSEIVEQRARERLASSIFGKATESRA